MARKVFFSFHYERDAWRAANVRNSDLIPNQDEYGVIDRAEWETIERGGEKAIRDWIQSQLKHTTCTVVLIGAETASREWVDYEIRESWERGNGVLGLRIHNIKNQKSMTDPAGANPLDQIKLEGGKALSSVCKVYDWVLDKGRENLGDWVEEAFEIRQQIDEELGDGAVSNRAIFTPPQLAAPTVIRNPPKPWSR